MNIPEITRTELAAKLDRREPIVLLEALPQGHYLRGHLPGARHLPHDEVRARAVAVVPDKQAEIVVYCASPTCQNSGIAAAVLASLGYGNVRVFPGGKQEWQAAGLPLEA